MKTKTGQTKERIIWAIDPFVEDPSIQKNGAWAIHALTRKIPAEVEPVYCLESTEFEVPLDISAGLIEQTRIEAEERLGDLLRRIKIPGLLPLCVLVEPAASLSGRVNALLQHARELRADLIVACSRAKKGPARWVTGSFAETLMLRSEIPLFLVNPNWDRTSSFKEILFPTDFSEESASAFKQVIEMAARLEAKLALFHQIHFEIMPAAEVAFSAYAYYRGAFQKEIQARQSEAEKWVLTAKKSGVQTELFLDTRLGSRPSDRILKLAAKKNCMIAMASHSGPWATLFLGSTTRQVARGSKWPLWIVHPRKINNINKSPLKTF